ncbi:type IV pilus assembly protein PilZ [Bacteriovorax sp. BSW11_IV]|uniref:PilZ domain-containing protein n=1 Tax=Bacteriovorax sp. BSW11_IV TaxID=1353529 RepID=UPI00038A4CD8|nr:PilZ domain-containing protein [Bacteriovorax sp. BSW11_IV]EQC44564.1 type IV pilus assembly protein PilZ [Bacteriovorax sp. BSW11_IV]
MKQVYLINLDNNKHKVDLNGLKEYLEFGWIELETFVLDLESNKQISVKDIITSSKGALPPLPNKTQRAAPTQLNEDGIGRMLSLIYDKITRLEEVTNSEEYILERQLRMEIDGLNEANRILHAENSKLKQEIAELKRLNEKVSKYENQITEDQSKIKNLEENILYLNEKKKEYARKFHQSAGELEKIKDFHGQKEDKEERKLVGSLYEVTNEKEWLIRNDDGVKGPYSFEDIIGFKKLGMLDEDYSIKKESEKRWAKLRDRYEVWAPLQIDEMEGKKTFYIKRADYRAPFYDVVSFDLNEENYKGHCTSLSVGGCFIELPKMPENVQKGEVGEIHFQNSVLATPFSVKFEIVRVSDSRPRGIGLKFIEVSPEVTNTVEAYIETFLKKAA